MKFFLVFAAIIVLVLILAIPINTYQLDSFANSIYSIPSPKQTTIIDKNKEFGSLDGNSDHCDYFASILIKSTLSEENILNYYKKQYTGKSEIQIYKIDKFTGFDYS